MPKSSVGWKTVVVAAFQEWIKGKSNPLDEQSKLRAYELFDSDIINNIEVVSPVAQ